MVNCLSNYRYSLFKFFSRCAHSFYHVSLLLITIATVLSACIILPIPKLPEKTPFSDVKNKSIRIGLTTKEQIKAVFGLPDDVRQNDSVYIYAKLQNIMSIISTTRDIDSDKEHLLIIQFDKNGIVKDFDHITGNGSETKNGIYVADTGLRSRQHTSGHPFLPPVSQMLVLYSNLNMDTNSKKFFVPKGKSTIYIYQNRPLLMKGVEWLDGEKYSRKLSTFLDNILLGDFGSNGYFFCIVDPGSHIVRVSEIWPIVSLHDSSNISIDCLEGKIVFIELSWKAETIFSKVETNLRIIGDNDEGRKEVLKRRMILDKLTQIED